MSAGYTDADVQLVAEEIRATDCNSSSDAARSILAALAEAGRLTPDGAERVAYVLASGEYSDFGVHAAFDRREDADAAVDSGAADEVLELPLYGPGQQPHRVIVYTASAVVDTRDAAWDRDVIVHERATWSYEEGTKVKVAYTNDHTDQVGRRNLGATGPDREAVVKSVSDRYAKARAERNEPGVEADEDSTP